MSLKVLLVLATSIDKEFVLTNTRGGSKRGTTLTCLAIFYEFPADFVRCTAQGTWSRGRKITIPGVSIGKIAITRVLVTREFAGTRAPATREYESATLTRDGIDKASL